MEAVLTGTLLIRHEFEAEIEKLALRYRKSGGVGLQVLNLVGGQAENLLERLPDRVKDQLEDTTEKALSVAMQAAFQSRRVVKDQKPWLNTALSTAMGAAGGFGGLPTALAELPVTTTVLLRAIQSIAAENGFDPADADIQKICMQTFAAAGPLSDDDGADLAFLTARITLTGATVNSIISKVAPRLATILGQKLAAQTVPLIGAAAGAATNYAYTSYYQDMAQVQFGLNRLGIKHGIAPDEVKNSFEHSVKSLKIG